MNKKSITIKEFATMGGKATLKKHGKEYFSKLAKKRWEDKKTKDKK